MLLSFSPFENASFIYLFFIYSGTYIGSVNTGAHKKGWKTWLKLGLYNLAYSIYGSHLCNLFKSIFGFVLTFMCITVFIKIAH